MTSKIKFMSKNTMFKRKNDSENHTLYDELNESEKMKDQIKIQLSTNNIEISFFNLFIFSQYIQNELHINEIMALIKEKFQQIMINNKIKEGSIISFFKMLQGENIQIVDDQYSDLCILSDVFQIKSLQKILQKYIEQHSNDIDFIIDLLLSLKISKEGEIIDNDKFSIKIEDCLINNICKCLQNEKFGTLNQSFIYRILEKSDLTKISSDLLFSFISKSIENRYLLFNFLNIQTLSENKFDELCEGYSKNPKYLYQYLSTDFLLIIKSMNENQKSKEYQFQKRIKELEEKNNELQSKIDDLNQNTNCKKNLSDENIDSIQIIIKELASKARKVNEIKINKKAILNYIYKTGNIELVKYLISQNIFDINSKDVSGKTIFHHACESNDFDMVKFLVSQDKFDYYSRCNLDKTVLHYACESGNNDIILFLDSLNKIDVKLQDNLGKTVLHYACQLGNINIVKHFISLNKIDINSKDYSGKNILLYACESKNDDLVKYLVSLHKIDINSKDKSGNTVFHYECHIGNLDVVKYIVSNSQFDLNTTNLLGKNVLHCACESGNTNLVKYLISLEKINLNADDNSKKNILHYGCKSGNIDIIKYLISLNKIDINSKDISEKAVIHYACETGLINIVKYFVSLDKINIKSEDYSGQTILHYGCESGSFDVVKYLISLNQVDLKSKDRNNKTILHSACKSGNTFLIKYIISLKIIDITSKDDTGKTILYYACDSGWVDAVQYLISLNQFDINLHDNDDKTILHYACESKNINMVKYLISLQNIDINSICKGKTPLYIATENSNVEIVQTLLTCPDVDVNFIFKENTIKKEDNSSRYLRIITHKEWPLLFIAIEKNNEKVVELLLSNSNIDINCKYVYDLDSYNNQRSESSTCNITKHEEKPALYYAIENERNDIALLFLRKENIDINHKYKFVSKDDSKYRYNNYRQDVNVEKPILYLATEKNNALIVKNLLLNTKLNVNSKYIDINDTHGYSSKYEKKEYTALQHAISYSKLEIIMLFLKSNRIDGNEKYQIGKESVSLSYNHILSEFF